MFIIQVNVNTRTHTHRERVTDACRATERVVVVRELPDPPRVG